MFELDKFLVEAVNLLSMISIHALLDEVGFLKNPDLVGFS